MTTHILFLQRALISWGDEMAQLSSQMHLRAKLPATSFYMNGSLLDKLGVLTMWACGTRCQVPSAAAILITAFTCMLPLSAASSGSVATLLSEADCDKIFSRGVEAYELGLQTNDMQQFEAAVKIFLEVGAACKNEYGMLSLSNAGTLLENFNQYEQAIECFIGAAEISPKDAGIYSKLGLNYGKNGQLDLAMQAFDTALALDPTHAMARSNKAVALERMGKQEDAAASWEKMVWPYGGDLDSNALYNWGIVQNQRMKLKPSLRAFKAFCRLFPDNERGWYMMAQVARNMDDVEVLVSASRRLFQLNPNHGEGYGQLGDALSDLKYYLPAISTLRKALEIRRREPGFEFDIFVEANYKLVLSWTCSWDEVEYVDKDLLEHLDSAISRSLSLPAPAHMLFNMKIPRELYRDWVDAWSLKRVRGLQIPRFIHDPQLFEGHDTRLIVGYVSGAGFQKTPGTSASRGVFQFHDKARFRIQCVGLRPDVRANDLRPNITNSCEKFFDFSRYENQHEELGRQLNALGWHILVDMSGLSGHHYVESLALKPAPVVVTWLEYPGSLGEGVSASYLLSDRTSSPPEFRELYYEKLILLPAPYLPNDYNATVQTPKWVYASTMPGEGQSRVELCAHHHVWKIDRELWSVWMRMMQAEPRSILRLQVTNRLATLNLQTEAEVFGIHKDRLLFQAKLKDYYQHVEDLGTCRLMLDAPLYNAHTSAGDVLWAGVPIVTLPGELMVTRGASSLLLSGGGAITVARTFEEYEDLAMSLLMRPSALARARASLRDCRTKCNLFRTRDVWVPNWEIALKQQWDMAIYGFVGHVVVNSERYPSLEKVPVTSQDSPH